MKLSTATAAQLPAQVGRPGYDRDRQRVGIVHLGIGAFHRAHQAVYTDDAMAAGGRDWAITGVSLRSPGVRDALMPQDGLYTVTERSSAGESIRLIGSVARVIVGSAAPDAVVEALAAHDTQVVTLTVTEKGYRRGPDGAIDPAVFTGTQDTVYHYLARAFAARRDAGLPGLTLVSCDNLANNGGVLGRAMTEFLDRAAPGLRGWFETECACPSTMVDRIVPATTDDDLRQVAARLGMADRGAVVTEPFRQWVIEDRFAASRPRWETGGAQIVADVAPYEQAKLRMLNGAHSALAYLGLAVGHQFVHQAIADPAIRPLVEQLMRGEAAASITPAPGQKLDDYADALLLRFANAALPHSLSQIATDGSQKIRQRWLEPIIDNRRRGAASPATLRALAAWVRFVRGDGQTVQDPMADQLRALWQSTGPEGIVPALLGEGGVLGVRLDPRDLDELARAIESAP